MECSSCGGLVLWQGKLNDLTHTECQECGAINNQVPDTDDERDWLEDRADDYIDPEMGAH